jgi:chaperonin GroES
MQKKTKENNAKMGLMPLADRVVIKEIGDEEKEKTTKSGIIIPVTVHEDKGAKRGEVVAVGSGKYENGAHVPMAVKSGDSVLYSWGDKVKIDGVDYVIVRESDIIAIIK